MASSAALADNTLVLESPMLPRLLGGVSAISLLQASSFIATVTACSTVEKGRESGR